MATHSIVLAAESQGRGSLVGCGLWGRTESDTTEATQQQQQQLDHGESKGIPRKTSTTASLTTLKPLTVWITTVETVENS